MTTNLTTKNINTWCPGCYNFMILAAAQKAISELIKDGKAKHEDFAMTTGIGCHAKIFDYINISGIYGLHGRTIPTAIGIKLGNPNLKVLAFAGDGDTYAEGMEHFIHAARHNADISLIVHDNRTFSLTTGQSTPTTQQGYKNKAEPLGEFDKPLNPIKLALAAGAGFVARVYAKDIAYMTEVFKKAIEYKGFAFVEVIQPCLIFNVPDFNELNKAVYKIDNKDDLKKAEELSEIWDYNKHAGKIPLGIFYNKSGKSLEEEWPQLEHLLKKKVGWKGK